MKNLIAGLLTAAMALSLIACASTKPSAAGRGPHNRAGFQRRGAAILQLMG